MAVGIDVTIDPSGAVSGGRVAENSLDKVGKAAQRTDGAVDQLTTSTMQLGGAQTQAGRSAQNFARTQGAAYTASRQGGQIMGQVGFQVSDLATQLSMGANAMQAIGVQGGQLLQAINPLAGAIFTVGAIIGGTLAPNLFKSESAAKELSEAMEGLSDVVDSTRGGVVTLSDDFAELSQVSEDLAQSQLALAFSRAQVAISKAGEASNEAIREFNGWTTSLTVGAAALTAFEIRTGNAATSLEQFSNTAFGGDEIVGSIQRLGDEFNLTTQESLRFLRAYGNLERDASPEKLQELSDVTTDIIKNNKDATISFQQLGVEILKNNKSASDAQSVLETVQGLLDGTSQSASNLSATFRRQSEGTTRLAEDLAILQLEASGNTKEAFILQQAWQLGVQKGDALFATVEELASKIFDLRNEQKELNEEQKEFDSNQNVIDRLTQQNQLIGKQGEELAVLRAQQRLNADATDEQRQEVERLARANYRQSESAKQAQQYQQDFTSALQSTLPDFERFRLESEALNMAFQQGAIDLQEYSLAMTNLKEQTGVDEIGLAEAFNAEFQKITADAKNVEAAIGTTLAGAFGTLTNQIGQATADVLLFGASGRDAAYQIASAIATQLISSLVKLGVQYALNVALGQSLATASLAATAAQATASAAMWATPAALASLATLGANAVPANTALAGTIATSKAIAAIPVPGFAEGGMAYGPGTGTSDSFTAKLSNGEFVMPQKQTRRYAGELEAMRAGAFESGGATGAPRITIVNQTTGRIDSAQAEYVTREEVRVIIREETPELVGAEINNPYSAANRAMRNNYDVQRKL